MKLYFAGYSTCPHIKIIDNKNAGFLETYFYLKNKDYVEYHSKYGFLGKNLFLDSGAFSAFTQKKTIDIDAYIEYIKKNKSYISVYANLDVIGDWEGTKRNQEYMEANGVNPLPVFHYKSPMEELVRLVDKYDYIALGGLVPLAGKKKILINWLNKCFKIIYENTVKKGKRLTKVHGFGVNSFLIWKMFPFYSCDATSWLMGGKFRHLYRFNGKKIVQITKSKNSITEDRIKTFNSRYIDIDLINAVEFMKAVDYITRLWEAKGIKWE